MVSDGTCCITFSLMIVLSGSKASVMDASTQRRRPGPGGLSKAVEPAAYTLLLHAATNHKEDVVSVTV